MAVYAGDQGPINTAYVSYRDIVLTENVQLFWPSSFQNTPNVTAAYMRVSDVAEADLDVFLPDATQVSVGQCFIITNRSDTDFNLNSFSAQFLGLIEPTKSYYFILIDNTTEGGVWSDLTFGAGTATANAADLAGRGLIADAGRLDTNTPVIITSSSAFTVDPTNNAALVVWQGGSGTFTLPNAATVNDGFTVSLNNESSGGQITILADKQIDGVDQFLVGPDQSLTLIKSANNWWTLGYGQQTFYGVGINVLSVAGNTNRTLTTAQAQKSLQKFTGTLTGNITVFFPTGAVNQWTVTNATTGAFTLTVQLAGPLGTAYVIPQGQTLIFYSDTTTMANAPTTVLFGNGTFAAPSITFASDPDTGLYRSGTNTISIATGGTDVMALDSSGVEVFAVLIVGGDADINGTLTLPNTPLGIASGGTSAGTAAAALNALMPTAATNAMVYFNGTNWVVLPAGSDGYFLKSVLGVPTWVAP